MRMRAWRNLEMHHSGYGNVIHRREKKPLMEITAEQNTPIYAHSAGSMIDNRSRLIRDFSIGSRYNTRKFPMKALPNGKERWDIKLGERFGQIIAGIRLMDFRTEK